MAAAKTDTVRTAYLEGRSITVLLLDRTAIEQEDVPPPELPVTLYMPDEVAAFLCVVELDDAEQSACGHGPLRVRELCQCPHGRRSAPISSGAQDHEPFPTSV